jgi:hypothetical protein
MFYVLGNALFVKRVRGYSLDISANPTSREVTHNLLTHNVLIVNSACVNSLHDY